MIAGLYFYVRGGVRQFPRVTLAEIPRSLDANPWYRDRLVVLAGDEESASLLAAEGLRVHRVFDDAPADVQHDAAHRMKHWMCLWALRTFGEFLWVDWDTVALREPDQEFWSFCRSAGTPKFIRIPGYWATVNCGDYYASAAWADRMERSLAAPVQVPNDELLWCSILPERVTEHSTFWWGERIVNVWKQAEIAHVSSRTVFAHVGDLSWASALRDAAQRCPERRLALDAVG
ncbi:MAG: hypothetical protein JO306_02020 [Gemmatimonadetes bacterium]|nr:hypothetical protein [Gemmatimonadota bacterium]